MQNLHPVLHHYDHSNTFKLLLSHSLPFTLELPQLNPNPHKTPPFISTALHPKCPLCQRKTQSRALWCHSNLWPFQLHSQPFLAASLLVPNLLLSHFSVKLFLRCPSSSISCSPSLTHSQQIAVTFNSLWQEKLLKEKTLPFSHQKFDQSFVFFLAQSDELS